MVLGTGWSHIQTIMFASNFFIEWMGTGDLNMGLKLRVVRSYWFIEFELERVWWISTWVTWTYFLQLGLTQCVCHLVACPGSPLVVALVYALSLVTLSALLCSELLSLGATRSAGVLPLLPCHACVCAELESKWVSLLIFILILLTSSFSWSSPPNLPQPSSSSYSS